MSAFNANFLLNRQSRQSRKDEERESSSSWIREMTTDTLRYSGLYSTTLDASPNGSGVQIDIEENYDTIGTRVWDCSVLMSHQFLHHHRRLERQSSPNPNLLSFSSRTILEIGSGCGLLPIAMSKALPTGSITATEYLPGIIEHLQNQVSKNGCESDVKVAKLDWFCPEDINLVSRACDTLIMSDCTLNSRESPQILSTFEDILVTSYRHKFKEGGRVKHTDAIVGLCYQREGSSRFLKLARTRFDLTKIEDYHPKYSNFFKGKERYAVYHMVLKGEGLIGAVCADGTDVEAFRNFYESIEGGYSLPNRNVKTLSPSSSFSSTSLGPPPITAMKHMFPKVTYAIWLEFLDTSNAVNKIMDKLNPRYWEGFNPHITLSVGFKNKRADCGDGEDSDDTDRFSGVESENILSEILEKYHKVNIREPEVTIRTSKNKQGNGGKFFNVFRYDAYKATIPFLLIDSSDSLEILNEFCNDIVEGERDRSEFQPHVALAYYDSGEVGVEGFEEVGREVEEHGIEVLKGNKVAISFYEITGEGTSEWRCMCRREIGVSGEFEGVFKLFEGALFECEVRVSEGKGLGVFSKTKIPEGTFLGVYEGEIKDEEDDKMSNYGDFGNGQYLFSVPGTTKFFDAGEGDKGNWTRYINHSKEGCNVITKVKALEGWEKWSEEEEVILEGGEFWSIDKGEDVWGGGLGWVDVEGGARKRIEFYSSKVIEIGEELSFDYGAGADLGRHPFKITT
ncbi:hypothetical protein TrST_g10397 [Triparma strigata]|uniref:SET domain-containing protein n=1 Tax=Triparma strigata TaxID=1606541 RepID=A0A9W7C3T9_9STRA|nr:hypothetical protein TrST_g10397 [Triparma strigata]